jgi:predicted GTPase
MNSFIFVDELYFYDVLGTTSDPVDEQILWRNQYLITLIDTAGIRKKKGTEIEELRFQIIELKIV